YSTKIFEVMAYQEPPPPPSQFVPSGGGPVSISLNLDQLQAEINRLLSLINYLKDRLAESLGGALVAEMPTDCQFTALLKYGDRNNDVRCLQIFLKNQGTAIYPEGLVTGYFGQLTQAAVIRFQEKYAQEILAPLGLSKGTGIVGPNTNAKIRNLLGK
ncbi:MAG: peptidoglycan-binding domain-containing protein, partial [Minisyncoccales bacterium]